MHLCTDCVCVSSNTPPRAAHSNTHCNCSATSLVGNEKLSTCGSQLSWWNKQEHSEGGLVYHDLIAEALFPQVQHVWGRIKAPEMRASASGLGCRAALQVLALQKPKFSFNTFPLDLGEETTYFCILKGNKPNIEFLSFPWPFFSHEAWLTLKVVKEQSSEIENETFYPTSSLQRNKLMVAALLTITPRAQNQPLPGNPAFCSCQGSDSFHTAWRSRSSTK